MRLIVGGAYQGKRHYAAETYGLDWAEMADGAALGNDEWQNVKCVYRFQLFIRNQMESGKDFAAIAEMTEQLWQTNPNIVVIMDEVGSGIIPMEKREREWREAVGRIGCLLAEKAESVERLVCGCAVRIK